MGAKQKQPKRGVAAIIGKWPGNETDEEVEAAIAETKVGCPRCCGTGLVEMKMSKAFTRRCLACGGEHGFYTTNLEVPSGPGGDCVLCGGATRWTLVECDGCENRPE